MKTDFRLYNRKYKRDLGIEMDLWIYLKGKFINAPGCLVDNRPVCGIIKNIVYEPGRINYCRVELDNNTHFTFRVLRGKIVREDNVIIL